MFCQVSFAQKFVPPAGKQLLIIGQDLDAVNNYVQTNQYPVPGGHTVYIDLFNINNASAEHPYGGLGEDTTGRPAADVDWGAGKVNAHTAAFHPLYKNSVLAIGLAMTGNTPKFNAVKDGAADADIIRLGKFIKKVAKPVYLRIGYEFEGAWNESYKNAEAYKAAYRRVTEVLRRQGVTNFVTVWQTSASPVDDIVDKKHENIEDWYPGDDVVDWVALSWFLHPDFASPVSSIKTTQGQLAEELLFLARKRGKPVMIAESTPQGYDLKNNTKKNITAILDGPAGKGEQKLSPAQIWTQWYVPFFNFIHTNKDVIKAVAYINTNWDVQQMWGTPYEGGYWGNSQVQDNEYISAQWKKEITKMNWLHGSKSLFSLLDNNNKNTSGNTSNVLLNLDGYPYIFELDKGESHRVQVEQKGKKRSRTIKLISVTPFFEPNYWFMGSAQKHYAKAEVVIEVSGKRTTLVHRPYQMPVDVNGLRIFVEEIKEWAVNADIADMKDVLKDVRLSVRPSGQSWGPQNMLFAIKDYRWKANVYQNSWSALVPYNLRYYHRGEDYGAIPDKIEVVAPFAGTVTASPLPEGDGKSNAVVITNDQGIRCRIAHMNIESISPQATLANNVQGGAVLGKTGMTWDGRKSQTHDPHCHVELQYNNTILAAYPFLMEAYLRTYNDKVIAVAGNYQFTVTGANVLLDATRSLVNKKEKIKNYHWKLHNNKTALTPTVSLQYNKPGLYTEELLVTTRSGAQDRDFVQVRVYDSARGKDIAFGWAYYTPLRGIKAGTPVVFWNRLINTVTPVIIDYGDGSKQEPMDKESVHVYQKEGRYVTALTATGPGNEPITVKMEVVVEK